MNTSKQSSRKGGKYLKPNDRPKGYAFLHSLPVIIVFIAVTVMAWLIPLRPTMSESENRNLEKFPEFSVAVLLDGSYFDDISVWFSDTFTFRETWMGTAKNLETLYGSRSIAIVGDIGANDDIPEIPVSMQDTQTTPPTPETEPVPTETTAPEDDQQNTGESEPAVPDQDSYDPREEGGVEEAPKDATQSSWGGQIIEEDDYISTKSVIQIGNAAYKFTGFTQAYADKYAEYLSRGAELLDGKARLFTVLAPENTTFMLTREDRLKMGCKPEEDAIEYIYSNIDSRVKTVSVFDNLIAHNSEYLAFRTDHHWTATGAYYAYEAWCEEAEIDPVPLSAYEVVEYPGFTGSYYSKAARPDLLEKDTVVCYVPQGNIKLYLSDRSQDGLGWEQALITDRKGAPASSKYLAFLAGDHAKGTFINDDITDGSACLVIKTSVGNPFVYYLTQHYQYVYVLDIRYYSDRSLTSFVDYFEIDDVIFMHGTGLAMSSGGTSLINRFIK